MRKVIFYLLMCLSAAECAAQWATLPPDAMQPQWEDVVPQPVYPDTNLVKLYYKAWETAAGRVRRGPEGMEASPYLDENCYDDQIWIWDGCFMVMFSKYAPSAFPGKETLMNYYAPIHDGVPTPLRIHWRDNPPLFAWIELENYLFTADTLQVEMLERNRYLERHYDWFNNLIPGEKDEALSPNPIRTRVWRDDTGLPVGYSWTGNASGMDNTPRGRDCGGRGAIMWVDAIAQQALSAKSISRLKAMRGDMAGSRLWDEEYERLKDVINDDYWDEEEGFYFDRDTIAGELCRVMTPASFWAMLAEVPDSARAARMVDTLLDPMLLGGERPWTSLSRRDPDFDAATGDYWRGGIWLPMAYMGTKALEKYGYNQLADSLALSIVNLQARTFDQVEPHTIWETYSPVADAPSTEHGRTVRQEFCGWSALGPISLFIENVLGFRRADGVNGTLTWDLDPAKGSHGIRGLRFGPITASLVYADGQITADTDHPFTLILPGDTIPIPAGHSVINL